jgi:hypothetical protein
VEEMLHQSFVFSGVLMSSFRIFTEKTIYHRKVFFFLKNIISFRSWGICNILN